VKEAAERTEPIWQDVECGSYSADISLWLELAGEDATDADKTARVLDLGAGTGRVSLALAQSGHIVTAIDSSAELLEALHGRARERRLDVRTVVADVRSFDLDDRFDLSLAPMQLFQLLPTSADRLDALRHMFAHLRPGGRAAIALLDLEAEPVGDEYLAPLPDVLERGGRVYSSQPVAIRFVPEPGGGGMVELDRVRQAVSPGGEIDESFSQVRLAAVSPEALEEDAGRAGFVAEARRHVPATTDHVASLVAVLRRPGGSRA
jgi:SAM-dependent methyltransferase